MKQLGNLAMVCARRSDVLMQIYDGAVTVHVGSGPDQAVLRSVWSDDRDISRIIYELNFGKYTAERSA